MSRPLNGKEEMNSLKKRLAVRLLTVITIAGSALVIVTSPANASGVTTGVQLQQNWLTQTHIEDSGDPCDEGDFQRQDFRVVWNMFVFHDGVTVNSINLSITNYSRGGLFIPRKTIRGGNQLTDIQPYVEFPEVMNGGTWSATYQINGYYTWEAGQNITFSVVLGIPCAGSRESVFQLHKAVPFVASPAGSWYTSGPRQIKNVVNNSCIVTQGAQEGSQAFLYSCTPAYADQFWTLVSSGEGYYQLRSNNSGKCLTAPSWNGRNVIQYTCGNNFDQQWQIKTWGLHSQLVLRDTGQCLIGPTWANGDVIMYPCGVPADQYWKQA